MLKEPTPPLPPNTGRIIDYWFGGTHHYPVDVQAADGFVALYSEFPTFFKASRAFTGRVSRYMREQGVEQFVVIGAGIPDSSNVHGTVPGARVLYSDIDHDNVRIGREILAETPHVDYMRFDATDTSTYDLEMEQRTLGSLEKLGVVICGVAAFFSDEQLERLFQWFYDRAPQGSHLAFDFDTLEITKIPKVADVMSSSGPYYPRNPEEFERHLGSWALTSDGLAGVGQWRNPDPDDVLPLFCGGVAKK